MAVLAEAIEKKVMVIVAHEGGVWQMVKMEADLKNGNVVIVGAGGRVGDIKLEVSACMIQLGESLMEQGIKKAHVMVMLATSFNEALAYLEDNCGE